MKEDLHRGDHARIKIECIPSLDEHEGRMKDGAASRMTFPFSGQDRRHPALSIKETIWILSAG